MKKFHFGENLRQIREAKGITQLALGKSIDKSQSTINRMEERPDLPSTERINKMARFMGVPVKDLMPPLSADDYKNLRYFRLLTSLFKTHFGYVIVIGTVAAFVDGIYHFALGTFDWMLPAEIGPDAAFGVGLLAFAYILYGIRTFKRAIKAVQAELEQEEA